MGRDVAQGPDAGCGTGLVGGQWASIRSCGDRRCRSVEGHHRTRASMACIGARAAASVGTCAASGSRAAAPITRSAAASSSAATRKPARSTRCSARRSWAVTSSRRCARAISRRSLRLDLAALVSGGVASPAFVVESECHVNADPAHDQLIRIPKDRAAGTRGRARLPERLTRAARRGISVRAPAPVRRARDSNRSTA